MDLLKSSETFKRKFMDSLLNDQAITIQIETSVIQTFSKYVHFAVNLSHNEMELFTRYS